MPLPFVFVGGSLIRNLKFSQLSSRTEGGRTLSLDFACFPPKTRTPSPFAVDDAIRINPFISLSASAAQV